MALPDHAFLLAQLPDGLPYRRLEAYLSLEAVITYLLHKPGAHVTLTMREAPAVAMVSRLPLLAIRSGIQRLERGLSTHPTAPETPS